MTARPLRILVPNFPAPDSFTDNVVHTLRAMGHEVRAMQAMGFRDRGRLQRIVHDGWAGYRPQTLSAQEKWVLDQARGWRVDLVLCLTLALRHEVLSDLGKLGVGCSVAWWGDSPANMRGLGLLVDGWDRIYIKDAQAVAKFRAVELPAEYLPEAANPDWHFVPEAGVAAEDALVVAGNYYGYRQLLVERLDRRNIPLALYGSLPPRWSNNTVRTHFRGRYIVKAEKSRIFNGGIACLNSTSLSEGDSLNCRAFEICAAGGLQLIENKPAVRDCFEPGRELLTYDSVDEIVDHLARARVEPRWAHAIRAAGHARVLAEHTYQHRLARILQDVGLGCLSP